jgi:hypothetical protein
MAPKKPKFPSRPCPKCHKPIHIKSKSHEACGWSADGGAAPASNGAAVANQQPDVNKSAAVRAILDRNPKTPVKEIVSTLAAQGVTVSANYAYMLKSKAKARRRVAMRQKALAVSAGIPAADPVALVREVRQLAARAGGLRPLKQLVDVLAE